MVVVDAIVEMIFCVVASAVEVIWTVADASVAEVEIVVVLLFGATSPFSSFLIRTSRIAVEFRRLNLRTFLGKNKGLRMPEA